ncbi:MAG: DUF805 domain-containing protein [Ruminobacter sp.]|uniref:DUF805 domain-containing protein n=1 Tax=Ruminobacter sp. TaxID=2774296 RepID=UPI0025794A19|nr:DUF805 domain-containing protein [Ruminobacter sp.]MBQ3774858.1 DUF805 domain-containing protein [Ruminobacter sp.]
MSLNQNTGAGRDDDYGDYGFVSHSDAGLGIFNIRFIRSPSHDRGYSFMDAFKTCINKMFTIRGRACRSEFWWYALFMFFLVMPLIAGCVPDDVMIGSALELLAKISLAAVTIRRLHDKNRNGLWIVPVFLPWIGSVYLFMLLVCFCFKGTPEENRYGVDPLG